MVKQRMTALDVRASVEEMRATLVGLRLLNIFNITNKMFLFKFGHADNKKNVLLENGVRLHLTELEREKPKVPSQFTLKLRKHVRAWRLDTITQLQHDRTVDLCFGVASTEGCFHIIIELFSKGNVILTDHHYKIMMLLRTHHHDGGLNLMVNEIYPVTTPFAGDASAASAYVMLYTPQVDEAGQLHVDRLSEDAMTPAQRAIKADRLRLLKSGWDTGLSRSDDHTILQHIVAGIEHLGPDLAQHVMTVAQVPNKLRKDWTEPSDVIFAKLQETLLEACDLAKMDLTTTGGYLIPLQPKANSANSAALVDKATEETGEAAADHRQDPRQDAAAAVAASMVAVAEQYESLTPILLAQYSNMNSGGVIPIHRSSFGQVCEEFFLITETGRIEASNDKQSKVAKNKEAKFVADHARRIGGLESEIAKNNEKGEQLLLNAVRVDDAIQLINGALATGIPWEKLRALLKRRNAEGHPVAYLIHDLFLERNAISVLLEATLGDDEDDCDVAPLVVEVSLAKTAHANAADYFARKKQNNTKLERTVAATDKAAAGAARKGAKAAAKHTERKVIVKERQRQWWEKFLWFRTTAGDLVLRGRDVQSTELLLRRVRRLGDLFIQCDVDGSLPCLLRPMTHFWPTVESSSTGEGIDRSGSGAPVVYASLCEAGVWCVALSAAWESKQTTGAWWIYASQVSGGSAMGAYLFDGERHHLPPQRMALGVGLLFYVTRTIDQQPAPLEVTGDDEAGAEGKERGHQREEEEFDIDVLRQELPNMLTSAQLQSLAEGNEVAASVSTEVAPADTATALAAMPTIETLRSDQRRQQQQHQSVSGQGRGRKGGTGYARNARIDHAGLHSGGYAAAAVSVLPSNDVEKTMPSIAGTATPAPSAADGSTKGGKTLSKYQKRKLRKIQSKYGDQDEEDRVLGAQVNGNQLSRVQLLELERAAEMKAAETGGQKGRDQAACVQGTLRHRPFSTPEDSVSHRSPATSSAEEDEEKEIEVVSAFTNDSDDDDDAKLSAENQHRDGTREASCDFPGDDLAADSEKEEPQTATASPTTGSALAAVGNGGTAQAAAAVPPPVSAGVDLQADLHRAFGHYTSRPALTDTVHHVVAVCAPLLTVGDYAYRVPLTLGNAKKGILAAKVLQTFADCAQRGEVMISSPPAGRTDAMGAGGRGSARKKASKKASPEATTALTGAKTPVNASLVQVLQLARANEVVEQLRANVKAL